MQVDTPVQQAASAPATLPAGIELKATLTGHTDRVWHIAPHPQRPLLATASADKTVRIYATNDYHLMGIVEGNHKRSIRCCDWKHGETKPVLATASFDSTAGIWDCVGDEETGEGEWECAGLLEGHENEVKCVAWSASGTLLATCSRDKSIWIWEAENYEDPECVSVMQEHSGDVKCVVWHPQEELLASGSYDDDIRLWRDDGDDWICCAILKGHDGTVWQLDFEGGNGLGQRLVSVSGDGTARIWRRTSDPAAKGKDPAALPSIIRPSMDQVWEEETQLPAKHEGDIYTVSWSKNTGRIATSGADGSVIIYKQRTDGSFPEQGMNTWDVVLTLENGHGVSEINHVTWGGLSADGKSELLYTAGDDCVSRVWAVAV
ncbi:WD40-repeat-containing domain protein [Protomyces lactucae-debilis]|uniref:Probable cytosolic iron-sulfur protein assembly protein 1 n=1 Tax=Protomyces lactucae-debilis TaxID=2754530 RepID=A0A1Y2F9G3_PROLT|nr:WD40-repeat-containing domain protein [Protomyces lactucae-debilis]ORY80513.1 WD40-repeat-containing domain protein [Protomyces lactucae-debilis]